MRSQRNAEEIIVSQRQDVETLALVWVPTHTFGTHSTFVSVSFSCSWIWIWISEIRESKDFSESVSNSEISSRGIAMQMGIFREDLLSMLILIGMDPLPYPPSPQAVAGIVYTPSIFVWFVGPTLKYLSSCPLPHSRQNISRCLPHLSISLILYIYKYTHMYIYSGGYMRILAALCPSILYRMPK